MITGAMLHFGVDQSRLNDIRGQEKKSMLWRKTCKKRQPSGKKGVSMEKIYYVTRIRQTDCEWLLDVKDFEPIHAKDLREAKKIVNELYGGFIRFRTMTRKYHPEKAGTFYI